MLADLRHYYQVNLLDAFAEEPTLTPTVVLWLVEQLPEGSALNAAMRGGPQHRVWTSDLHLQAAVVNMLYAANRQRSGKATKTGLVTPPAAKKAPPARVLDLKAVQARLKGEELRKLAEQAEPT